MQPRRKNQFRVNTFNQLPRTNCQFSSCHTFPCKISYKNLVLDQDNNFYLIMNILITYLLDNVWILQGEVTCWSHLRVKGLKDRKLPKLTSIYHLFYVYGIHSSLLQVNHLQTIAHQLLDSWNATRYDPTKMQVWDEESFPSCKSILDDPITRESC